MVSPHATGGRLLDRSRLSPGGLKDLGQDPAASAGREPERLGVDLLYLRVEIGQLQPGQLRRLS